MIKAGDFVIIRTQSMGVHFGKLVERKGSRVTLTEARRIWSWSGALSCSELAISGPKSGRISVAVDEIDLLGVGEVIRSSEDVAKRFAALETKS